MKLASFVNLVFQLLNVLQDPSSEKKTAASIQLGSNNLCLRMNELVINGICLSFMEVFTIVD